MAKEKKTDINFDKLTNLDLDADPNIEEVKQEEIKEKKVKGRVGRPPRTGPETIKTSYRYTKDVHLALKRYCLDESLEMGNLVFEQVMKEFLTQKGYYPPKKR